MDIRDKIIKDAGERDFQNRKAQIANFIKDRYGNVETTLKKLNLINKNNAFVYPHYYPLSDELFERIRNARKIEEVNEILNEMQANEDKFYFERATKNFESIENFSQSFIIELVNFFENMRKSSSSKYYEKDLDRMNKKIVEIQKDINNLMISIQKGEH